MNPRSLKFQLIGWYALVLTGCFTLLAAATYLALKKSLVGALAETQLRRARQVSELVRAEAENGALAKIGSEVDVRYAPATNDRFVRVTQKDGVRLYLSPAPTSQSFEPATLPPPEWPRQAEAWRQTALLGGRKMLIASHVLEMSGDRRFLVEIGAPMDGVQADLRHWAMFLGTMLPALLAIALGGGYVLVKRALLPVARITESAERISSHNLSERLPIPETGDELERLSLALNRMIERLDSAFQHSRQFVADASHELRTPLTVLRGELEMLARQRHFTDEWRQRAGSALEETDRLTRIVDGLFSISRLDSGEAVAERVPLDLSQLVSATVEQMALLAEDKGVRVGCEASPGVWVKGDRSRLKQLVVNLLDNAIKYTPEGGEVSLKVGQEAGKAFLEVIDTGMGIPAEALPRVFDRFYRVDSARSRDEGGAGLGLSIVRSICMAHEGSVKVTSAMGKGSRFRVELPFMNHQKDHNHDH